MLSGEFTEVEEGRVTAVAAAEGRWYGEAEIIEAADWRFFRGPALFSAGLITMDMQGSREEEYEFFRLVHDALDGANLWELPAMVVA